MSPRRWRKMTWAVNIWSGLVLLFIIFRVMQIATKSCSDSSLNGDCLNIALNGKATVALSQALVGIVIWIVGFIVLAVIWFMTRQQARTCPHCGNEVEKGVTACRTCGYDFALGKNPSHDSGTAPVAPTPDAVASTPPEGWYDDAERPGRKRWWDGRAWGMRDDEHPSRVSVTQRTDAEITVPPAETAVPRAEVAVAPTQFAVAPAGAPLEYGQGTAGTATTVEASSEAAPAAARPAAREPASAPVPQARFCENCGAERRPGGKFCTSCGHA